VKWKRTSPSTFKKNRKNICVKLHKRRIGFNEEDQIDAIVGP
jgi:hypothetical protein